jgi:hypothetical protein
MIDVKAAAETAAQYLRALFPDIPHDSIRLEEVELDEAGEIWFITLSFLERSDSAFAALATGGYERKYKVFAVDAVSGKVKSMKIRLVEHAP